MLATTPISRPIHHHYQDPLDRIWIHCAESIGFRILRTPDAYASTDGQGAILIGDDSLLDADDTLAQMILHELCHALIEGEDGQKQVDWGLGYRVGQNPWREHACLRLQAYLAGRYGLRDFLAPTTDFRMSFWNQLPTDPFAASEGRREKSCIAARIGAYRALQPAWWKPLNQALKATAEIAVWVRGEGHDNSLWNTVHEIPATHPVGHAPVASYLPERSCDECAWQYRQRGVLRCRLSPKTKLEACLSACVHFEPAAELDCLTCGACCREAYQAVEISSREPLIRLHPELVVRKETHIRLKREGERCAALIGGCGADESYACAIYADRPRTCREFERGGEHCLEARRRVGLSL